MKKKTVEELEQAAKQAEARAKELRAKAKQQTQAEEAKLNADLVKAVEEWRQSFPEDKRIPRKDMPAHFRAWAEKNRAK